MLRIMTVKSIIKYASTITRERLELLGFLYISKKRLVFTNVQCSEMSSRKSGRVMYLEITIINLLVFI